MMRWLQILEKKTKNKFKCKRLAQFPIDRRGDDVNDDDEATQVKSA